MFLSVTKELVKSSQKQAEVIQAFCDKVLSEKESEEFKIELQRKLPRWDAPSPTPSLFQDHHSPTRSHQHQDKEMELDERMDDLPATNSKGNREIYEEANSPA